MTTNQIINLNCKDKENQKIIQKVLRQIKPLSRYSNECDIPFDAIEKAITVMCKKYMMRVSQLTSDVLANDFHIIWKASLTNDTNFSVIDTIYGITLYEVFAKTAIRLYTEVKKGIEIRS